jgi:hypothetical protein
MRVFTTGQVAKICKVAPRTVSKWFDSGQLKGWRIPGPGSQDRRIPEKSLIVFLKAHGMPYEQLLMMSLRRILLISACERLRDVLLDRFTIEDEVVIKLALNGFDAGMLTNDFLPEIVIIDFGIGKIDASRLCSAYADSNLLPTCRIITILRDGTKHMAKKLQKEGISDIHKTPFEVADLCSALDEVIREEVTIPMSA